MRAEIEPLIESLRCGNKFRRNDAPLFLGLMLERYHRKGVNDPVYEMVLPQQLLEIGLTEIDVNLILKELADVLFSDRYSLTERAAISQTLGKNLRMESFEAVLHFILENHELLDEEGAYCTLVAVTPSYFPKERHPAVLRLVEQYQTLSILNSFLKHESERVADLSSRIINSINKMTDGLV